MAFIFHYTLPPFFFVFNLECSFRFPHQQTEKAFSRYRQPDVLIFASIFDFSLLFSDVYGFFKVMPHGFASKPCSQTHEFAF